jgi:hypothetical protein
MAFPSHRELNPLAAPESVSPLLVHHHHRWSEDGTQLLGCAHRGAAAAIDAVNLAIRAPLERLRREDARG